MIEQLIAFDKELFLFFNGFHNELWDTIMWYVSKTTPWIPLYIGIIAWLFFKNNYKQASVALLMVVPLMFATDSGSVHLFKEVFERLRPCHDPDLTDLIHNVRRCGGKFGFISSHASNTFGVAVFFLMLFKNRNWTIGLLLWASLVSYSRIYLGVHFPADIIGGAIWGTIWAVICARTFSFILTKFPSLSTPKSK